MKELQVFFFFCSLISETIPFHRDYQASLPQERLGSRKVRYFCFNLRMLFSVTRLSSVLRFGLFFVLQRLRAVINELESLKPEFNQLVDKLNRVEDESRQDGSDLPVVSYSSDAVEWPPAHKASYSRPDINKVRLGVCIEYII